MNGAKVYGELTPCGGGDPVPLLKRKLIIGRRSSCDITLRFPNVSSHHCELELINGFWHVKDLGSSNGVRVNAIRCDQKWLFPGDVLHVARHKFEVHYEAVGEKPVDDENPFARSLLEKAGLTGRSMPREEPTAPAEPEQHLPIDPDDEAAARDWLDDRQR